MSKDSESTRTSRTRVVAVESQIQALVLKKALNEFVAEIEKTEAADGLLSSEDIIYAAEELLERVEALSFFQAVARAPRAAKTTAAPKPKTSDAKNAATAN